MGDDAVLALSLADSRVLVTFDKDFGEMAFRQGKTATCGVVLLRPRLALSRLPCAVRGGGARSSRYLGRQLFGSPRRKTACGSVARITNQNRHFLPLRSFMPSSPKSVRPASRLIVIHPSSTGFRSSSKGRHWPIRQSSRSKRPPTSNARDNASIGSTGQLSSGA